MISYFVTGCTSGRRVSDGERKHARRRIHRSGARVAAAHRIKKKRRLTKRRTTTTREERPWKARAADATGRGGRDARRWEARLTPAVACCRTRTRSLRVGGLRGAGRAPRRSPSATTYCLSPGPIHFGAGVPALALRLRLRSLRTSRPYLHEPRRLDATPVVPVRGPPRADECGHEGVRRLTKRSRLA